jgi:hypothetical protein
MKPTDLQTSTENSKQELNLKQQKKKQQNQIKIQTTKNKSDFFLLSASN